MKPFLSAALVAVLLGLSPAFSAEVRTFTSAEGRTLSAEIVSATVEQVSLKLADGSTATLPINRLAEADRDYVRQWLKSNPGEVRYNFTVDWSDECLSGKQRAKANGPAVVEATEKWVCHLKIMNRSGQTLENLEVRYQIHYTDVDGRTRSAEHVRGSKSLPLIKSNETVTVDSEVLELSVTQLAPGWTWMDPKMRRKENDDIKGVVVTLYHQGKQVHEFASRGITKAPEDKGRPVAKPD